MPFIAKDVARRLLAIRGAYPTRLTAAQDVRGLLAALRPIDCGIQLLRLGPHGDGGYLLPDDLDGVEACYSPGVSDISGFEEDCANAGMRVFLADRSVDKPAVQHERFQFTKKYVGARTSEEFMTLDDWVETTLPGSTQDLMLQIDIEGWEYETFLATSDRLMKRFRIVVAEFHMLGHLWSKPFFSLASSAILKLLQTHVCVHIHPNNCCGTLVTDGISIPWVMEFTFLRKDRVRSAARATTFPHPLDCNNTSNPSLPLPAGWYRD